MRLDNLKELALKSKVRRKTAFWLAFGDVPMNEVDIPKKDGGVRTLKVFPKNIRKALKKLSEEVFSDIDPGDWNTAYRKNKGIKDAINPIVGATCLVTLDIEKYYDNIHVSKVKKAFEKEGFNSQFSHELANLFTYEGFVPQGSPASPAVSNLVGKHSYDEIILEKLPKGWEYRRYCDNLWIYTHDEREIAKKELSTVIRIVKSALWDSGYKANKSKTNVFWKKTKNRSFNVFGLSVSESLDIPKKRYKDLRLAAHLIKHEKPHTLEVINKKFNKNFSSISTAKSYLSSLVKSYYKGSIKASRSQKECLSIFLK